MVIDSPRNATPDSRALIGGLSLIPKMPLIYVLSLSKINPEMFWLAVAVATVGNTLGGMVDWLMGYGASKAQERYLGAREHKLLKWFEKMGPPALLFLGYQLWVTLYVPLLVGYDCLGYLA